jgi:hypothetical protein
VEALSCFQLQPAGPDTSTNGKDYVSFCNHASRHLYPTADLFRRNFGEFRPRFSCQMHEQFLGHLPTLFVEVMRAPAISREMA